MSFRIVGLAISTIIFSFTILNASAQQNSSTGEATLLIYTNTNWQGKIGTSTNSTSVSGDTNKVYSFACNNDDTYSVSLKIAGSTGEEGKQGYLVTNLIQNGKMLDVELTTDPNGNVNLSGQCNVGRFSLSNNGMVSFSTDKTTYTHGEPIQVSGSILQEIGFYNLDLKVINSQGMVMTDDRFTFQSQFYFHDMITTRSGLWTDGNYKVLAQIADSTAEADITIIPVGQQVQHPSAQNHATTPSKIIPNWIKNNAKWWSEGSLDDKTFVMGIQFMLKNGIIVIPYSSAQSQGSWQIPSWIKNTAGWWANGQVSDDEFIKGIQYLVGNGIIQVS